MAHLFLNIQVYNLPAIPKEIKKQEVRQENELIWYLAELGTQPKFSPPCWT